MEKTDNEIEIICIEPIERKIKNELGHSECLILPEDIH